MRKFAFVSRHEMTETQIVLAASQGVELVAVGDRDAFAFPAKELLEAGFDGVVVVHPMAALTAERAGLDVGIFENVNRAPEGEKPQFEVGRFIIHENWMVR